MALDAGAIAPNDSFRNDLEYPDDNPTFARWRNAEADIVIAGRIAYFGPGKNPEYETRFEIDVSLPGTAKITLGNWFNASIS